MLDVQAVQRLLAGTLLAAMFVGLVIVVRHRLAVGHAPWQPYIRRYLFVKWTGPEVTLAFLLYLFIPNLTMIVLLILGIIPVPVHAKEPTVAERYQYAWVSLVSGPLIVAAILGMLWHMSRTRPRRIGFTPWRWRDALALSYVSYVIVTPLVIGLNLLTIWISRRVGGEVQAHPFEKFVESIDSPAVWVLVAIHAVILAPLLEELLVRGIMFPWLARRPWGGWVAMGAAVAIGASELVVSVWNGQEPRWASLVFAMGVSIVGTAVTWPHAGEQWARRAIIGTALLFAMMHVAVWPSPIPLFVLGLALGWIAFRARNLIAPITLHAMFNATAVLLMIFGLRSDSGRHPEPTDMVTRTAMHSPPPPPGQ